MKKSLSRTPLLALIATVFLTACGDRSPATPPSATSGPEAPATAPSPATAPAPATTEPAAPAPAPLTPRTTPLAVGDAAPAFQGLPDGPVVLMFYRGHW